jgi:hypothetical protein
MQTCAMDLGFEMEGLAWGGLWELTLLVWEMFGMGFLGVFVRSIA